MIIPSSSPPLFQYAASFIAPSSGQQSDYRDVNVAHVDTTGNQNSTTSESRAAKQSGRVECQTCKQRKYQDGSNDPGVSFKSPTHISPDNAGSAVMAHEQEHVRNESAKAVAENRVVVSQSVTVQTSVCPECGRTYVSGGLTRTVTKAAEKNDTYPFQESTGRNVGRLINATV